MSFGFSVGDFLQILQITKQTYRNCKQAGGEYLEIAQEVRSLHSILRSLREEAEKPGSVLFRSTSSSTSKLPILVRGCRNVLEDIDRCLAKYHGLADNGATTSAPKKLWHRLRFGGELDELPKFRSKIITYTTMLAVALDSIQLEATGRVENKVDAGFSELIDRFEGMRTAVFEIATRARVAQRQGSVSALDSQLSLSTYADDDKEVWRRFRSELVAHGFRSDALDTHMDMLKAYMMRLNDSGLLDQAARSLDAEQPPWWANASFRVTNTELPGQNDDGHSMSKDPDVSDIPLMSSSLKQETAGDSRLPQSTIPVLIRVNDSNANFLGLQLENGIENSNRLPTNSGTRPQPEATSLPDNEAVPKLAGYRAPFAESYYSDLNTTSTPSNLLRPSVNVREPQPKTRRRIRRERNSSSPLSRSSSTQSTIRPESAQSTTKVAEPVQTETRSSRQLSPGADTHRDARGPHDSGPLDPDSRLRRTQGWATRVSESITTHDRIQHQPPSPPQSLTGPENEDEAEISDHSSSTDPQISKRHSNHSHDHRSQTKAKDALLNGAAEALRKRDEQHSGDQRGTRARRVGESVRNSGGIKNPKNPQSNQILEDIVTGLIKSQNSARPFVRSPEAHKQIQSSQAKAKNALLAGALDALSLRDKDELGGEPGRRGRRVVVSALEVSKQQRKQILEDVVTGLLNSQNGDATPSIPDPRVKGNSRSDRPTRARRVRSLSPRRPRSSSYNKSLSPGPDLSNKSDSESEYSKLPGVGMALAATIHAAHNIFFGMEKREARKKAIAEGEMTPEEAKKLGTKSLIQDAAQVGIAALGIRGALAEWKEVKNQKEKGRRGGAGEE